MIVLVLVLVLELYWKTEDEDEDENEEEAYSISPSPTFNHTQPWHTASFPSRSRACLKTRFGAKWFWPECARPRAQRRGYAEGIGETESNRLLNIAVAEDCHTPPAIS